MQEVNSTTNTTTGTPQNAGFQIASSLTTEYLLMKHPISVDDEALSKI